MLKTPDIKRLGDISKSIILTKYQATDWAFNAVSYLYRISRYLVSMRIECLDIGLSVMRYELVAYKSKFPIGIQLLIS